MTGVDDSAEEHALEERLICGARVDELLDRVCAGRAQPYTEHETSCPHCQAALGEYQRLWAPVRELAATEVRAPDSFLEDAMRRLRGTAAETTYAWLPTPTGSTRIAARVVVVTARETAQDVAGVRVALSRIVRPGAGPGELPEITDSGPTLDDGPRVVAGVAGRSTAIEVTLAADYGVDLVDLAERIRTRVTERVHDLTGLEPVAVTVRIDDVLT